MSEVKRCEATFLCPNCGHSITIRTFASVQKTCKWCGCHFTMYADGVRFKHIDWFMRALDEDHPAIYGTLWHNDVTIEKDETEIQDD